MSSMIDYAALLRPKFQYGLYNPGVEFTREFSGETYVFPADGELKIGDLPGRENGGLIFRHPVAALEIVRHFVGENGRTGDVGPRGVRLLTGNPAQDAQIKAEAQKIYAEHQYLLALKVKADHEALIAAQAEAGVPQELREAPTRQYLDALQSIRKYRQHMANVTAYACPKCNLANPSQDALDEHLLLDHPDAPAPEPTVAGIEDDITVEAGSLPDGTAAAMGAKRRGRPPKHLSA